jgi:hypothetical protein
MGDSDMAMERAFMPLNIFIVMPFINEFVLEYRKSDVLAYSFLLVALVINLAGITVTGKIYKERTAYIDELLENTQQLPGNKFIMEKADVDMSKIIIPWAIGAETLLYSSLGSPDETRTLYMVDDLENFNYEKENTDLFLCVNFWRNWSASGMNQSYFNLQKDSYQIIKPE